jgi:MFS family permease
VAILSLGLGGMIDGARGVLLGLGLPETTVASLLANSAWRLLMISGALPALLIFLIRMGVPESDKWQAEKDRGATSHWLKADLVGVLIGAVAALSIIWAWSPAGLTAGPAALVTVLGLAVSAVGYVYPVLRFLGRSEAAGTLAAGSGRHVIAMMFFGAGLAGVTLLGTWGAIQWIPRWAMQLGGEAAPHAKEYSQIATALGAIVATFLTALVAERLGRRPTFAILCLATIAAALWLYQGHDSFGKSFLVAAFLAGGVSASFYGLFPLYFPELFPTAVRATGQGFALNFGRIIAAVGGLQTAALMGYFGGSFPKAGSVLVAIYLVGAVIVWLGPETKGRPLPD